MSNDWEGFSIGQQPTLILRVAHVKPIGRTDEGWHEFLAQAVAEGFTARFNFQSLLAPFEAFRDQIRTMHESLSGEAHFESTELNVAIEGAADKLGHVSWSMSLRGRSCDSPVLRFCIEEDQTLLLSVSSKIDKMLFALQNTSE